MYQYNFTNYIFFHNLKLIPDIAQFFRSANLAFIIIDNNFSK